MQYPPMSAWDVEDIGAVLPDFFFCQLPKPLQRDLLKKIKHIFMKETSLPMEPRLFDCRYVDFQNKLNKHDFIMMTNILPEDSVVPHFWSANGITGHVNFDYYEYWVNSTSDVPYNLCRQCFIRSSGVDSSLTTDDDDVDYKHYWSERGWTFFNVTSHYGCQPDEFVETVLKRESSWCDFCIFTPLFRLYDWDQCEEYTNVHDERTYDDDSSVDSEESVINTCTKIELYDPYHV